MAQLMPDNIEHYNTIIRWQDKLVNSQTCKMYRMNPRGK